MRYALISDIHANLPALEAVLDDIEHRGDTDAIYHLGDLVGYAPWPNEVVERLRETRLALRVRNRGAAARKIDVLVEVPRRDGAV